MAETTCVRLSLDVQDRIAKYLQSPITIAKNKTQLFEIAIKEFLDREEIIQAQLEEEFFKIRRKLR